MKKAKLSHKGLETRLEFNGIQKLKVASYPENSEGILNQFSAFHLLGGQLPPHVESDFPISAPMQYLIGEMYKSVGKSPPTIKTNGEPTFSTKDTSANRSVISYSAGKDSQWNLWWNQKKYGKRNVLAVHIKGLNRSNSAQEGKFAKRQSEKFGFPMEILEVNNGASSTGYNVMISRDMFMVGILAPYAMKFNAKNIVIEGFGEVIPSEPFTGVEKNMNMFNKILREMGLPVQTRWKNRAEMDVVKELYTNVPEWMPEVCNCFSADCYKPGIKRSWERRTPSFEMYDSQCGSCVKCRIINLGRINYEKGLDATDEDIRTYIASTENWIIEKHKTHGDMITPSFMRDLRSAAKQYGVKLTKV